METIKIPSPSAILDPPPRNPIAKPPASNKQPRTSPTKPASSHAVTSSGINRPKQSKSRNGCITCKTKRLKCDETKPTCLQCHKRNVTCGGYKKDFKWRPFEETILASKSAPKAKKATSPPPYGPSRISTTNASVLGKSTSPRREDRKLSTSSIKLSDSPGKDALISPTSDSTACESLYANALALSSQGPSVDCNEPLPSNLQAPGQLGLSSFILSNAAMDMVTDPTPFGLEQPAPLETSEPSFSSMFADTDDVEDIIRQSDPDLQLWPVQDSPSSTQMGGAPNAMMSMLLQEPDLSPGSEEMLIIRFDRQTCGILSVKDGVLENPWRTWIWPMAKQSPALYHAVFAMAAFHSSKESPAMRFLGMEHMRKSILCMVQGMEQMRTEAALATTLSLAFAESWDQHTSTGIQHLKGAKALMRQTLNGGSRRGMTGEELARLRFLYNTWLYMDVIARLTSLDEGDKEELAPASFAMPLDAIHEVDPLMGCATTLFPLIGRAANLIQRVRKTDSNSFAIISEAIDLKTLIERWEPPQYFEPPEDPTSDVQHSFQTAQAYRWATLLYLHQAVPEIPSESAPELAKRVLILLATVPLSSRTTIVHIYPLLAASCEAEKEEDRSWILQRWAAMQTRLKIGNIDRCIDVVREVWRRRDSFKADKQRHQRRNPGRPGSYVAPVDTMKRTSSDGQDLNAFYSLTEPWRRKVGGDDEGMNLLSGDSRRRSFSSVENIEFEKTVRGRLHWIGVMKDWNWEVLLG
ncbi:hypothetical protein VTN77DRAFT_5968 [Rasamsonia byssochlamydoides]|uniref:uncharacterized protein n=1 Tax=Rasamsonia byssochlamydoides TaxID=89139 RepID=UPI0037421282